MGNGKQAKIIAMPGPGPSPGRITQDQATELRAKMQAAVIEYLTALEDPQLKRQDLIEKCANTVTLVINILSISSDAVSVCTAARIIRDRMDLIRDRLLPAIISQVPNFPAQEQDLVDMLLSDTGVVLEIYNSILDDDQMQAMIKQFKDTGGNGE